MPESRKILAAAPPLAPDDPAPVVAFACSPEWVEANLPVAGADGQPAKAALPRFSMVAYTGGPMRLQGWRHPVIVDLAGLAIPTQNRPIRLGHDAAHGVGHTDSLRVEGGKLIASGLVSRDTAAAREVVISSKNGFPWQASIGAAVEEHEFVREGQTVHVNGRAWQGPVNVVRRSSLGEISFVDLGADGNTSALVTAHTPSTTPIDSGDTPAKNAPADARRAGRRHPGCVNRPGRGPRRRYPGGCDQPERRRSASRRRPGDRAHRRGAQALQRRPPHHRGQGHR